MRNMYQNIHEVIEVRAIRLHPSNSNSISIEIETMKGTLGQALYFGDGMKAAAKAAKMPDHIQNLIYMAAIYFEDGAPQTSACRLRQAADEVQKIADERAAMIAEITDAREA